MENFFNKAISTIQSTVKSYGGTEVQKKVREATSSDAWNASNTLKSEIAEATYNYESFQEIVDIIWDRLKEKATNYVRIIKALTLLDYLIRNGSSRVVDYSRSHMYDVRMLENFEYHDGKMDKSAGIREMSDRIIKLLHDEEALTTARKSAEEHRSKFVSITNSNISSNGNDGGKYGGMGSNVSNSKFDGMGSDESFGNSKLNRYESASNDSFDNTSKSHSKEERYKSYNQKNTEEPKYTSSLSKYKTKKEEESEKDTKQVKETSNNNKTTEDPFATLATKTTSTTAASTTAASNTNDFDADFESAATKVATPVKATAPAGDLFDVFASLNTPVQQQQQPVQQQQQPDLFGSFAASTQPSGQQQPMMMGMNGYPQQQQQPMMGMNGYPQQQQPMMGMNGYPQQQQPMMMGMNGYPQQQQQMMMGMNGYPQQQPMNTGYMNYPQRGPTPAPQVQQQANFDVFASLGNSSTATKSTTTTTNNTTKKTDDLWDLTDLDISSKPAPATTTTTVKPIPYQQPMMNNPSNNDVFASLVEPGRPTQMYPQQQQPMMNNGFPQQYPQYPQQQYPQYPQQQQQQYRY